jgi:hypothetical protein
MSEQQSREQPQPEPGKCGECGLDESWHTAVSTTVDHAFVPPTEAVVTESQGRDYEQGIEDAAARCERRVRERGQWLLPSEKIVLTEMAMQIRALLPRATTSPAEGKQSETQYARVHRSSYRSSSACVV